MTAINHQGDGTVTEPPHRRLQLKLSMGADTLDDLCAALYQLTDFLAIEDDETREVTSGGYTSGHHFTLTCDPDMDGDRFRAELAEWSERRRAARG